MAAAFVLSSCAQDVPPQKEQMSEPQEKKESLIWGTLSMDDIAGTLSYQPVGGYALIASTMNASTKEAKVLAIKTNQEITEGQLNWQKINIVCNSYIFIPVLSNEHGKLSGLYSGIGRYENIKQIVEIDTQKLENLKKEIEDLGVPLLLQYKKKTQCYLALKPMNS